MTQIIVDISQIRTKQNNVLFVAEWNNNRLEAEVPAGKLTTPEEVAAWLLERKPLAIKDDSQRRRLTIDFHAEQVIDPDFGEPITVRVIDSVVSEALPEDTALVDMANLPGWATWSGAEAEAWINTNVTDLDSAKVALVAMAKMIVAERDALQALVERSR